MKQPKVAVFYDWLNQWGGAERVLLDILRIYPEAKILTLVHDKKNTEWLPPGVKVETSFLNPMPGAKKNPLLYTPLYGLAVENFDLKDIDILISTTSTVGQGFLVPTNIKFVCYFHNVNRYLYSTPKKYIFLRPVLRVYQKMDRVFGQRPDLVLCNSENVKERIKRAYGREAKVVYPGVDVEKFVPGKRQGNYFLTTGRLVAHKRIDLAVEACGQMGLKLKIAGDGRERKTLQKTAKKYGNLIEFLGWVPETQLVELYQECLGLICPQEEDFGLTPVEVQACGRGVVAFGRGGVLETVLLNKTGVFFDKQESISLKSALNKYLKLSIKTGDCRQNAVKFSDRNFMLNFRKEIDNL